MQINVSRQMLQVIQHALHFTTKPVSIDDGHGYVVDTEVALDFIDECLEVDRGEGQPARGPGASLMGP